VKIAGTLTGNPGELWAITGKAFSRLSPGKLGALLHFQEVTISLRNGLWLQWSWVQSPSLTLPSPIHLKQIKHLLLGLVELVGPVWASLATFQA
jgi:hypothetical protein